MGLASKMAAAQGGAAPAYGAPQQAYPPAGQQPPRPGNPPYPTGAPQYQAYPGGPAQPPPQGQYPGQQQPPYGAPAPGGYPPQGAAQGPPAGKAAQTNPNYYRTLLQQTIQEKHIQGLFQNPAVLDQICQIAPGKVQQLIQTWRVEPEVGQDIVKLALFDIIIYVDDSGSMQFEEGGERIQDLKLILSKVAYAASLFDQDGIEIRFMNSELQGNNIHNAAEVDSLISRIQFKGLTPMGTQLRNKVLEPFVVQKARSNQLRKPVLIITITDGQPAGEPTTAVFDAIRYASNELARSPYGKGAVSFQFAQVGNDLKAREFLGKLDNEPGIGELIDSTSNFEVEQDEMSRANPPLDLTPDLWLCKLLLGAIDSSYDTKDEKGSRQPAAQAPYGAPQGQYGAPPPAPYGQQPPYGQPQYGAQPQGYPPQQQYGQQPQYGAPQGQYGAPPPAPYGQQPQYGAPQGQYGAPPPAPYGQQPQYGAPQGQYGAPQQGYPPQQGGQAPYKPPKY